MGSPLGSPGLRPAAAPSRLSPLLRTLSPQPPSFGGHSPPFAASLAPPFADLLPELASRGSSAAGSRYGYGFVSAGSANSAGWRTPRDDARGGTPQGGDFSSAIVSLELPGLARLRLRGAEAAGVLVRCVEQVGAPLEEQLALLLLLLLEANPCNKRAVQQWDGVAPFVRLAARCDARLARSMAACDGWALCFVGTTNPTPESSESDSEESESLDSDSTGAARFFVGGGFFGGAGFLDLLWLLEGTTNAFAVVSSSAGKSSPRSSDKRRAPI